MKAAGGGMELGAVVAGRYEVRFVTIEGPAYVDYRVHDREVEVELSLWRMDPALWSTDEKRAGFEHAARQMRGIVHPNLRRLFEAGRMEDGTPFLISQLGSAEGIALRLDSGRTASELDILRYANALAEGLEALHAEGIVHGHLVPVDVVEVAGVVKLSGAGLYGGVDPGVAAERWGAAGRYLAPEVIETGRGDPRADVYSMAAILCELASGVSRPDLAEATEALAAEQLALADLFARALSRAPDRRPGRPAELVERIRRLFVDERVPTIKRPTLIRPEAHPTIKSRALQRELDTVGPAAPGEAESDGEGLTIEESSPLFLDPSAAPRSPLFPPNQPTLTDQRAPRGVPPPAAPAVPTAGPEAPTTPGTPSPRRPFAPPPVPPRHGSPVPRPPSPVPRPASPVPPHHGSPVGPPSPPHHGSPVPRPASPVPPRHGSPAPPPVPPGPPTTQDEEPLVLPLHSRRPPSDARPSHTPIIAAIDRPEMQPVLRPLSSLRQPAPPQQALGHYAPPRDPELLSVPPTGRRLLLVIAISAALLLGAIALVLAPWDGEPDSASKPAAADSSIDKAATAVDRAKTAAPGAVGPAASDAGSAAAGAPPPPTGRQPDAAPSATRGPCAPGMALVSDDLLEAARRPYCVDRHEWPGAGLAPRLALTLDEAATQCRKRRARLCRSDEWEDACRGSDGASYPYGTTYVDKKCNARGTDIAKAGSFPECQSAAGAFDMSGNAAEWDADGGVRGASAVDGTRGRCSEPRRGGKPRERVEDRADIGFRCCADPLAQVTPSR
jgi:serine/threonine protein kinase